MAIERELHIYTVTRLTREIRDILEAGFAGVWVEGEISNLKKYPSGHLYFSLKDENSLINCVLFRNNASGIGFEPEDGMTVLSRGRVSVYDKRGQYQLYVSAMEPRGKGALQLAFEQLKKKLLEEGLFDAERKKPLPALPFRVGVVTSPAGAAIEDILNVARRRFANIEITICPVRVQGAGAADEIAAAIEGLNEYNCLIKNGGIEGHAIDVMIVGRGGGSLEDLWPFNEEKVARAISGSEIPVISAVGHEVDHTISDMVSDMRAPTPSAAAELVMPRKEDLEYNINALAARMDAGIQNRLEAAEQKLDSLRKSYVLRAPLNVFTQLRQQVDDLAGGLYSAMDRMIGRKEGALAVSAGKMRVLSPLSVLERGYSITFKDGSALKGLKDVAPGDMLETKLASGTVTSRVESTAA